MLVQWNSQVIISYYHSLSLLGTSHSKAAQCTRALKFVQKLISHFWRYCWFWSKGYWIGLNCWISNKTMYSFDYNFYHSEIQRSGPVCAAPTSDHRRRRRPPGVLFARIESKWLPCEIAFGWFARNLIGWPNLTKKLGLYLVESATTTWKWGNYMENCPKSICCIQLFKEEF